MIYALYAGCAILCIIGVTCIRNTSNHPLASIIGGCLLILGGLSCGLIGHDKDMALERNYVVTEVQTVSTNNNTYRISLEQENGTETWIYVAARDIELFPKDSTITMSKQKLNTYKHDA